MHDSLHMTHKRLANVWACYWLSPHTETHLMLIRSQARAQCCTRHLIMRAIVNPQGSRLEFVARCACFAGMHIPTSTEHTQGRPGACHAAHPDADQPRPLHVCARVGAASQWSCFRRCQRGAKPSHACCRAQQPESGLSPEAVHSESACWTSVDSSAA